MMKIAITSTGDGLDSRMDARFGRAKYFVIVDTETMECEAIDNTAAESAGGAGITSGQTVADKDVQVVITGNVGPNAMNVLRAADIAVFRGEKVSINENIELYKKGKLTRITSTVPSHFGMNQ